MRVEWRKRIICGKGGQQAERHRASGACDLQMFIPLEDKTRPPDVFAMILVKCWIYRWCWI